MIIGMIGNMGKGKTLSAVRYLYKWFRKGFTIYSNIHLKFPHIHIGMQELIDYANAETYLDKSIVFLDEAHTLLDSRNSASKRNKILTYFIVLTRKMGCNLVYTTQRYHQIDKRLRDNSDVVILCDTKTFKGEKYTHNLIMIKEEFKLRTMTDMFRSRDYYGLYNTRELVKIE
jgi:hypothetical protein